MTMSDMAFKRAIIDKPTSTSVALEVDPHLRMFLQDRVRGEELLAKTTLRHLEIVGCRIG